MNILILGANGMLGHKLIQVLSNTNNEVYGAVRTSRINSWFEKQKLQDKIITNVDVFNFDSIMNACLKVKPDVIINCIGIIKQLDSASDPIVTLSINSLFPHRLAKFCNLICAKLIQISTDCVFNGTTKTEYFETDDINALDLYGQTKYLGEVNYGEHLTLRTSIIGHELEGKLGLIEWFMKQEKECNGFSQCFYSGFPTLEFAYIVKNYVLPNLDKLNGLYQVSSSKISKLELLQMIRMVYGKKIEIKSVERPEINRVLNSDRFKNKTGYIVPFWESMIDAMFFDYKEKYL